jgi:hypothetical protein
VLQGRAEALRCERDDFDRSLFSAIVNQEPKEGGVEEGGKASVSKRLLVKREADLFTAFRLSGKTITETETGELVLRLESFSGGRFRGSFFVTIDHDEAAGLIITRHTLPYFVDVAGLASAMLNRDVAVFADAVVERLNAWNDRRDQAEVAQVMLTARNKGKGGKPITVQCSLAVDHVLVEGVAELWYEALAVRPAKVLMINPSNDQEAAQILKSNALPEALQKILQ